MGISEQSTLLCEQKLSTSRQIFRYAVPARTVTKKALVTVLDTNHHLCYITYISLPADMLYNYTRHNYMI